MLSVFKSVVTFSNELSIIAVGVIAIIFTFGFVQAIKRTLLTPFILAYVIPEEYAGTTIELKNNQNLYFGEFLAESIQWIIFMIFCYVAWTITKNN